MDEAQRRALLDGLDDAQREAVTTDAAPLLVVAGAGSGKTRVLTRRIAYRDAAGTLASRHTLALTFTRKAAGELRDRLTSLGLGAEVTAGTFHAIALAQLRRRALDLGQRPPVILNSKLRLLSLATERDGRQLGAGAAREDLLGAVAGEIEWAKARLLDPTSYPDAARLAHRHVEGLRLDEVADLFLRYEEVRQRRGVVDFDDLLANLARAIESDSEFAAAQRWQFRHLFVDELQDANAAQLRLLDAWLGGRPDLFAVGDARQAIYGWNGADPSGVTQFTTRYPGAAVLELEANYRSTLQLVTVASSVLTGASQAATPRGDGPAPGLVAYRDEEDEAEAVAAEIHRQRNRGRRYSQCAVLARTNAQLGTLERVIERAGIPIATRGAHGFLARPAVRDALRPIAASTQPARFAAWRKELTAPVGRARARRSDDSDPDVLRIVEARLSSDLQALADLAEEYAKLDPLPHGRGFVAFLRHALGADPSPVAEDAVDVLTFHRSKGLEWPVVFVTGLEDGYVPIARATTRDALEEERRLLYVALSRAGDELFCSWVRRRSFGGTVVERAPSPYVDVIEAARARLGPTTARTDDAARRALAESRRALGIDRSTSSGDDSSGSGRTP